MKQLNATEYLAQFDRSIHDKIRDAAREKYPDAVAAVCFKNQQLDSSACGDCSSLMIGPSNTYKTMADVEGHWLNDLPSRRQYPVTWCVAEELRK